MNRGDLYLARLEPAEGSEQRGTRPIVIVSRDRINNTSPRVVAVPFTTQRLQPLLAYRCLVHARPGGLRSDSIALCEQIRVLDKGRLSRWPLGALNAEEMSDIEIALRVALGLSDTPPIHR